MKDPLQAVKLVSWQSIIIGTFMAIKIPESIIFLYILSRMDSDFSQIVAFSDSALFLAISIFALSLILIFAGYHLLQKKAFARNILEIVFWFLLAFVLINIVQLLIKIVFHLDAFSAVDSIYGLSLIPFIFLGALLLFNLYLLRNKKVKRVLS